jgi:methyl-accepting chemotaxis protein
MNKSMQESFTLAKYYKTFIVVMALISIFGGYQLSQFIYGINVNYLQRTEKILKMERSLDEATVALSRQIQEWKDMLLRVNDTELYNKHKQAFTDANIAVQNAFMSTKMAMQDEGMDTEEIDQLLGEHQSLRSDYMLAKSRLNPRDINSYLESDQLVIGVDRKIQRHIAVVKTEIQHFSNQQLNKSVPVQGDRYMLGLVGALSLLIMTLVGLLFGSYFSKQYS